MVAVISLLLERPNNPWSGQVQVLINDAGIPSLRPRDTRVNVKQDFQWMLSPARQEGQNNLMSNFELQN